VTSLNVDIHLVESLNEMMELKRWMSQDHPYLAVDTESEGLMWWKEKTRLFQVGNADVAYVLLRS